MKYIHATDTEPVIQYLTDTLSSHLAKGEKVLWILSGGSGGKVCAEVSKRLTGSLDNLITTLSDERYVPFGDIDENWQQLIDGGFSVPGATTYRPIAGKNRATTAKELGDFIKKAIDEADYKIGLFGIGTDGHIAGLKPETSAVNAAGWTTDFTGDDFQRITMTFDAIKHLDEVILQAMGPDKTNVIEALLYQDLPITEQPAQILKSFDKSILFTDYKGETA